MVISKQGGVQLVRWSYRSKSGWVWLIPLSSPNDAAVEESSSKMRLFQKFSRCGWCWKFFKDAAVPEVLSKVRMMAESSSKTRLFQKFSRRCEWCWKCSPWRLYRYADCLFLQVAAVWMDLLYVEMCVESSFKGVVRLVLDAWCGYGEFLFNLQPCGYLWRGMKSQCMVRLWRALLQLAVMWVPLERPNLIAWCGSFNAWCGCLRFLSQWFSSRPRMVPLHPLIFRFNKVGMYSSSPWQGE